MKLRRFSPFAVIMCLALPMAAVATEYNFNLDPTGNIETTWSTAGNWSDGQVPSGGSDTALLFGGPQMLAGENVTASNNLEGTFVLNSLNFTYGGPANGTRPTFKITGNALQFVANAAVPESPVNPAITINPASGGNSQKPSLEIAANVTLGANLTANVVENGVGIISGQLGGAGSLTKTGAGLLTLAGDNGSYSGAITVSTGALGVSHANALGTNSSVTVGSGGALRLVGGITTGAGKTVTISGTGLSGTQHGALNATGAGNVWQGEVVLASGSTRIGVTGNSAALTVSGKISSSAVGNGLVIRSESGSGIVTLSGGNTYSGPTGIVEGILSVNSINSVAAIPAASNLGAPTTAPNGTISFGVSNNAAAVLSPTLRYTGGEATTNRIIHLNASNAGSTATIQQNGTGTLTFAGNITTTGDVEKKLRLSGSGAGVFAGNIVNGSGTGIVSLAKLEAGTWTLSGANTYTGATNVNAGTLLVNNVTGSGTGTGVVTVANGATLGGTGTVGGATVVQSGGTLSAGNGGIGELTFSGNLTFGTGSIFGWEVGAASYDQVTAASLGGSGGIFSITNLAGSGDSFTDAFWDTDHTWDDIFDIGDDSFDLSLIFTSFGGGNVSSLGVVTGQGGFSFVEGTSLKWTAEAVPEPGNALAGLLIVSGFLSRRRKAPRTKGGNRIA